VASFVRRPSGQSFGQPVKKMKMRQLLVMPVLLLRTAVSSA
jgi:hypothetical protein